MCKKHAEYYAHMRVHDIIPRQTPNMICEITFDYRYKDGIIREIKKLQDDRCITYIHRRYSVVIYVSLTSAELMLLKLKFPIDKIFIDPATIPEGV